MQSMPYYPPQGYAQAPQYPAPGTPGGATVMTNGAPMLAQHHGGLPPMQHHDINGQPAKRKQVKNACTNCQKACKKCDDARPCPRCIKYGIADSCVNSVRKERKKGIKRGPYKRRQKSESDKNAQRKPNMNDDPAQQYANAMRAPPPMPYGFPTNLNQYGQPAYDAYNHYYKDQAAAAAAAAAYNVVNPMYPQMAYPVLMQGQGGDHPPPGSHPQSHPATTTTTTATTSSAPAYQLQHPSLPQHYGNMVQHQPTPYPEQQHQQQQPVDNRHSVAVKSEAMTPMPSASTTTTSSSSPPSESTVTEENTDANKFAGLSQLVTAALHPDSSTQETRQHSSTSDEQQQSSSSSGQESAVAESTTTNGQESKIEETPSGQESTQQ